MDVSLLAAAGDALVQVTDPFRLLILATGVLIGLVLGIVPGIGGLAGLALLLPFTFALDSYAAFALLLGMFAVTGTSDTIPAVLFGVPGSSSAQATIMDGNPMAKRGEAGRALSAAYTASLIGGLFGAAVLALTIPFLRPVMLYIGTPELLALSLFGISMVAVLSGKAPIRGLIGGGLGILLSMIGADLQTGTLRWTLGTYYLWDGLPLIPMLMGIFALPELADLAIKRQAIAKTNVYDTRTGLLTGMQDALRNWWLVLRCGGIGAGVGALPGLGSSVVDWIAYGHAVQTVKGGQFGKGDVRGVIAPESANNAITAGSLVPTVAFGVPGSAGMAILLSVFLIHGLVPGPEMLSKNLSVTYSMVWSIALANILGAGICFAFSGQLAKIALLRYTLILPVVIVFVYVGSFQSSRSWGDLYALLFFFVIGWTMKQLKWPRPPLILGFVLGALIERYMFLSWQLYGAGWVTRPIVMVVLGISFAVMAGPLIKHFRSYGGIKGYIANIQTPRFRLPDLMHLVVIATTGYMVVEASQWPEGARMGPMAIGIVVIVLAAISLGNQMLTRSAPAKRDPDQPLASHEIHMDTAMDFEGLPARTIVRRAAIFFAYLVGFLALMATIGLLLTIPVFVAAYMRIEGSERWKTIVIQSAALMAVVYVIFDRMLYIPWPPTLLGRLIPALSVLPTI